MRRLSQVSLGAAVISAVPAEGKVVSSYGEEFLAAAAVKQGFAPERALALATALGQQLSSSTFYVFRSSGSGGGSSANTRKRQVVAFSTADTALAFAQLNMPTAQARVRVLTIVQLLAVLLQEPAIRSIIFIADSADSLPPGRLPDGLRLQRDSLLRALRADASAPTPDTPLIELN